MKIQLKFILQYSVQTNPDFYFSAKTTLSSLKQQISDIFNISIEQLLLKIQRDKFYVLSVNLLRISKLNFID